MENLSVANQKNAKTLEVVVNKLTITLDEESAWVDFGDGVPVWMATRDAVHGASIEELNRMIYVAYMTDFYHSIKNTCRWTVH